MTVVLTEAVPSSVTTLRKRVRRLTTDRDTNSARQIWSDADIDQAIIDQLYQMFAEMNLATQDFVKSTTITYPADTDSYTLADGLQTVLIQNITDVTSATSPIIMSRLDVTEADALVTVGSGATFGLYWFRTPGGISVRPKPTVARSLKIWYLSNPMSPYTYDSNGNPTTSVATNQHSYPIQYEELITLGAAIRLLEEIDTVSPSRQQRYQTLWDSFVRGAYANGGPARVTPKRMFT